MAMNSWYTISNQAESSDEAEVMLYDAIGFFGITADQFVRDFKAITAGHIRLRINSPGGEVTEAAAIYNAIKEHPARITVHVDGLAASAASVIAMSGDEVRMADNSYMMIHNASGGAMGGSEDLRRYADLLEKMNDGIAAIYAKKTGQPKSHWRKLMAEETWMTAKEAKAEGLADTVYAAEKPSEARASAFDFKAYNKVPAEVLARFQANQDNAPVAASREDAAPAIHTQETPTMADTSMPAPAQGPIAGTPQNEVARLNAEAIQGYINQGRAVGLAEGKQAEQERLRKLLAACPGKPQIAVNAFLAGHDDKMVAMLVDAETRAEVAAQQKTAAMEVEIARLNAQLATGGHPGVSINPSAASSGPVTAVPAGMSPEAQADLEWNSDPLIRAQNSGKEAVWKTYRIQQLKGNVRVLSK